MVTDTIDYGGELIIQTCCYITNNFLTSLKNNPIVFKNKKNIGNY